ncbi:MAG TPA: hypothetical protein VGY76_11935 [Solirubrobacteraceae bacterium]|jgi:hypothetical protein|nr:hypothetical protein [Solirubrobacteraceae bacterium]
MSANTIDTTTPEVVTNCLGESRPITSSWPDGSYACPFCEAAVLPSHRERPCPNPMCEASPYTKPEEILRRREQLAESEHEAAQRKAQTEQMIAYSRQWQEQQAAEVAAARDAGYCVVCFVRSGHRRRVRHRTPNYHEQRAH